ncbi:Aldo/keto reductase [Cystobasidium minutum MCA 4210]|uniref:Aldo/keto reductase n=1 Tax=Cystobasidium minutum MCA 4210 TaxID=1397322 RepID=UPI0034CE9E4A|eukprot:jgi/Rhomi1/194017/gm1.2231_g
MAHNDIQERTSALVTAAVRAGFRAIDTAGQRKHYRQDLVGEALATLAREDGIKREEIFLQTKYTSISGQDAHGFIPYDPKASLTEQVTASFENSLKELRTTYIDSYLLHGPESTITRNVEALSALKPYLASNKLRYIGISNIYQLQPLAAIQEELLKRGMKLSFIQNRFYDATGFDIDIRKWCRDNDIVYQSFWTLTASEEFSLAAQLNGVSAIILGPAQRLSVTPEQAFYQFCIQEGICPLNGTTDPNHMQLGVRVLQGKAGQLTDAEMQEIRKHLY